MSAADEMIAVLQDRIAALEQLCLELRVRITALESHENPDMRPAFKMPDEEPTV